MGVCASCLGREHDHELSDEDEQSRLLFDDPHANNYGSFGENNAGIVQADPQEVQRENEALQKVVNQTSSHLVDIFAIVPATPLLGSLPSATSVTYSPQDIKSAQYQDTITKMSAATALKPVHLAADGSIAADRWMSDDEVEEEMKGHTLVKTEGVGALLGGFADADTAMT